MHLRFAALSRITTGSLLILAASATLPAQRSAYHPDNLPAAGGSNVIPFGSTTTSWENQRYQTLIPTSALGNTPGLIQEIAFSPSNNGARSYDMMRIRMVQTSMTTLSGNLNFEQNLGPTAKTVLDVTDYVWHTTADQWNRIGLQEGMLYIPARGNLLIDIQLMGAMFQGSGTAGFRSKSIERMYEYGWTGQPPQNGRHSSSAGLGIEVVFDGHDLSLFGESCKGSAATPTLNLAGSAKIGQTVDVNLVGAPANPPIAVLILGFNTKAPLLPVKLPGSCLLYQTLDLTMGVPTTSGGATVKIPNPNAVGLRYWCQYATLDVPANSLGLVLTNQGRVLIGN